MSQVSWSMISDQRFLPVIVLWLPREVCHFHCDFMSKNDNLPAQSCRRLIQHWVLASDAIPDFQFSWNQDNMIHVAVRSKITDFYHWHLLNFYTWCQRWKLDLFPDVVPKVCVCQVMVYARSFPIWCNTWIYPPNKRLPFSADMYFKKKAVSLCKCLR